MTQADIEYLINLDKKISTEPSFEFKNDGVNDKKDFKVKSLDGQHEFSVFVRKSVIFDENFSIGLLYHSPDGTKILLIRMNGPHGPVKKHFLDNIPHYGFHIHKITSHEIAIEKYSDPKFSEITTDFSCFQSGVKHFLKTTKIADCTKYFPNLHLQLKLDFNVSSN